MLGWVVSLLVIWYGGSFALASLCPCSYAGYVRKKTVLPADMMSAIRKVERSSRDKRDFLEKSYAFLSSRFKGYWFPYLINPPSMFWYDIDRMWSYRGVMTCLNLNYLSSQFLVNSKFFSPEDISVGWRFLQWFSFHKFLVVNLDGDSVVYDLWRGNLRL